MSASKGQWVDWVDELFPPAFGFTVQDVLDNKGHEEEPRPRIKRVSAFDPASIKNVYEKVRLMSVMEKEMTMQSLQAEEEVKLEKKAVDVDSSCIWSTDEIHILREVFKEVGKQNTILEVRLRELEKCNKELASSLRKQEETIQKQNFSLLENNKANTRLKIFCDNLQLQLKSSNSKLCAMEDMNCELRAEKQALMKEMHDVQIQANRHKMEKERLKLDLQTLNERVLSEKTVAVESVRVQCKKEILDIQDEVQQLTKSLKEERQLHNVTKKGLNHLRQHFASLPMSNIVSPNAVSKDQVSKISF